MAEKEEMPLNVGGVKINYQWYDDSDRYSDGDEVEDFIVNVFKEKWDVRTILYNDSRWPVLYHLSSGRTVITEPMRILKTDAVLEVGAGMGAITGALASKAGHVDCIELSLKRSLGNAYRNQEYDNIEIIVGNYENIRTNRTYDVVTLIGVLEYAGMYIHRSKEPALNLLQGIHKQLNRGGRLYIAIENRLGIKYFSGCAEDHYAQQYIGIEGYGLDSSIRTYSREELKTLLSRAGFTKQYFYYPLPDYKLPSVIYSEDYLKTGFIPPVANYDLQRWKNFDEQRALKSIQGEEFGLLANSFLVEVTKE